MTGVLDQMAHLLGLFGQIPAWAIYVLLAAGAATENVFPPVPSDTFVFLGAVLADQGVLRFDALFFSCWAANVVVALTVYGMARKYGRGIFETRWGRRLLRPHQLEQLSRFYDRYGMVSVLLSRFLPVFRVLVPAFAGISKLGAWRTAVPLTAASGAWYGALLGAGVLASRNLPRIVALLTQVRGGLWIAAALLFGGVLIWWWATREESGSGASG